MRYIYMLPAAILVPAIHEFMKALISTLQGDQTPREQGFLTANPFKYFEPIGFVFILMFGGLGWGQPTPTAALHYRDRKLGTLLTYMLPVLITLLLGVGAIITVALLFGAPMGVREFSLIFAFSQVEPHAQTIALIMLLHFGVISINFALFNLIPVYPLAAHKLVIIFGSPDTIARVNHYEKHMQIALILLLALRLMGAAIGPVSSWIITMALRFAN